MSLRLRFLLFLPFFVPIGLGAQSPDTIRVCTYNLLQFGTGDVDRVDNLRLILNEIRPEVLLLQDVLQSRADAYGGFSLFRDSVATLLDQPLTPFIAWNDSTDSQVMIFVDTSALDSVHYFVQILNDRTPRDQISMLLRVKATGDTIMVMTGYWKAGGTQEDEDNRTMDAENAVSNLRFSGIASGYRIFGGSLNVYSADEEAYQTLLRGDDRFNTFTMLDPIDRPGSWHDNEAFADVHTQSPRAREFGGGAGGGMSDRFDHILVSDALVDFVRPETYTAFGNDGNHFNDSINAMPNVAVSPGMAHTLHDASDHLPVFVDIVFGLKSSVNDVEQPESLDLSLKR